MMGRHKWKYLGPKNRHICLQCGCVREIEARQSCYRMQGSLFHSYRAPPCPGVQYSVDAAGSIEPVLQYGDNPNQLKLF